MIDVNHVNLAVKDLVLFVNDTVGIKEYVDMEHNIFNCPCECCIGLLSMLHSHADGDSVEAGTILCDFYEMVYTEYARLAS